MDLNQEIWNAIDSTPRVPDEVKRSLHVKIMRLVELSRSSPVGVKRGVTVMTQEASLAADKTAQDRRTGGNPSDAKPKTV